MACFKNIIVLNYWRGLIMNIVKIREKILRSRDNSSFLPNYNGDFEFYNCNKFNNCYAYALQLRLELRKKWPHFTPGFLSDTLPKNDWYDLDTLIYCIQRDCETIGIDVTRSDLEEILLPNQYRVKLINHFYGTSKDYHFFRENDDRSWSEKGGWGIRVNHIDPNRNFSLSDRTIIGLEEFVHQPDTQILKLTLK